MIVQIVPMGLMPHRRIPMRRRARSRFPDGGAGDSRGVGPRPNCLVGLRIRETKLRRPQIATGRAGELASPLNNGVAPIGRS